MEASQLWKDYALNPKNLKQDKAIVATTRILVGVLEEASTQASVEEDSASKEEALVAEEEVTKSRQIYHKQISHQGS